ncbi:hypothetical protein [Streptosporangium sp. LJ11]|uniref:hypothetical protein n=1 Tax=Streptosporangium sp. LJ11 TaxID=3436927 RepID=UPI003F78CEAD
MRTETGGAAETVVFVTRGLPVRIGLQASKITVDLNRLGRRRAILGETGLGRLLTEHLSAEAVDTVVGRLDRSAA